MASEDDSQEVADILEKLNKTHYSAGLLYQRTERLKAERCMENDELTAIHHLVESHVPSLRMKTVLRYEKILSLSSDNVQLSMSKSNVASSCTNANIQDNVKAMLAKVEAMPPEWTLVQLTPFVNVDENVECLLDKHYTNSLYMTVFNCGLNQPKPFCVNIEAPRDCVTRTIIPFMDEINSIIYDNKNILLYSKVQGHFRGVPEKQNYYTKRQAIDDRLKMLVKDLQDLYLQEWKCFLIGKYVNNEVEVKINRRITNFFKKEAPTFILDEKTHQILCYLTKASHFLKLAELRKAMQSLFSRSSDKKLQKPVAQLIRNISGELFLTEQKRHPIILILDDSLDCIPWEMMEIFSDVSVTRLPSLHLAYALYQEHKETIEHGIKIIQNPQNGTYVINPDLDLRGMQNRILSFYEYWLPGWKGIAGEKPTEEQFTKMLLSGDIFAYNGHGSGSHLFPMQKVEKIRMSAVVLLFGCSSTKLNKTGPQIEMYSTYQMYLIACSPCVIGNLWEVTDLDTDILATEFLSNWVPNTAKSHWKFLDKSKWKKGEKVHFKSNDDCDASNNEPELLKALNSAKKSTQLNFYITRAGVVARGIPVKIATK